MREYKFRAWAEKTVDNQFKYAWELSEEKFRLTEPSKNGDKWSKWYDIKNMYFYHMQRKWGKEHSDIEMYTKTNEMITDIKVNGTVTRPSGYKIINVMQYTEKKDKKGNEIYEGDILHDGNKDHLFLVVGWNEYRSCYSLYTDIECICYIDDFSGIFNGCVVGNIYENPELLE